MRMISLAIFVVFLFSSFAFADVFDERTKNLFRDIRCASCQTQTIEESNSQVAQDMRAQILKRINEGASDDVIRDELRAAYGDSIFLTPPVQNNTYFLWLFPALLLIAGMIALRKLYKNGPSV